MNLIDKHCEARQEFTWRTRAGVQRTLDKISDSHLMHIIGWIIRHADIYSKKTFDIMLREALYRSDNDIYVQEYPDSKINTTKGKYHAKNGSNRSNPSS